MIKIRYVSNICIKVIPIRVLGIQIVINTSYFAIVCFSFDTKE